MGPDRDGSDLLPGAGKRLLPSTQSNLLAQWTGGLLADSDRVSWGCSTKRLNRGGRRVELAGLNAATALAMLGRG